MKTNYIELHSDDKEIIINFVDYVNLKQDLNVTLEISARYVAKYLNIVPDVTNRILCNKFVKLLDSKQI